MSDAAATVSDYWAIDRTKDRVSWLQHPTMLEFVNRRVSGDPNVSTVEWFRQKYFPQPAELALSLGCGFGGFERDGVNIGIAKKFHANDISEGAVAKAREYAAEAGLANQIEYSVLNLDDATLPAATYDAIFALSAAHHVFQLEKLFRQCRKALKPGGMLFLDEYIGPSRFQCPPMVTDLINRLRTILPEKYRKSLLANDGSLVYPYVPSPVEHFEKHDPSEAVRSGEIISTLKLYFDIVEYRPVRRRHPAHAVLGHHGQFRREERDRRRVAQDACDVRGVHGKHGRDRERFRRDRRQSREPVISHLAEYA